MTNKSLEYFLIVVKHLNISRAAQELYISQPALSKQLGQLEAELGVTLFDRGKHSLKLTRAGEVLLAETNELLGKYAPDFDVIQATVGRGRKIGSYHIMDTNNPVMIFTAYI